MIRRRVVFWDFVMVIFLGYEVSMGSVGVGEGFSL